MGAGQYRGQMVLAPGAPSEDIAHGIHANATTGRGAPLHEQVATATVLVGKRQARDAAFLCGADLRHLHQRSPQAFAVYPRQITHEVSPDNGSRSGARRP